MKKTWFQISVGAVLICICAVLFGAKTVLVYESTAIQRPIDAIIVLGGGSGSRVQHAIELAKQYNPKFLIMTGDDYFDTSVPVLMRDYAKNRGIDPEKMLLETASQSTYDHPRKVWPILQQYQLKTIMVVTSKFHTRRSFRVFDRYISETDSSITCYVSGAPDKINYATWWKHHEMIEKVGFELIKSLYYFVLL
ncbi:YdcF family protein [bacterium]|nr:YdcF family protein [bacterium]